MGSDRDGIGLDGTGFDQIDQAIMVDSLIDPSLNQVSQKVTLEVFKLGVFDRLLGKRDLDRWT